MAQTKSPFLTRLLASRLINSEQIADCLAVADGAADDRELIAALVKRGMITAWQASLIQEGRTHGFLLEHYKILEPLGAGGMGQIYRAIDTKTGWHVAVKVLPKKAATPEAVRRFRREGDAAIRVQHDHIVRTHRLGQQGDTYFLVMELVTGVDLAKYIARHGKLSVGETVRIGYEASLALEHARHHGIIHRDVKPSNILLTLKGQVKLTDMGLAKFFGTGDEAATDLTRSGAVLGTIDFMAPEQAEDAKRADTRSDIYSLGCTLYKCLTGRAPFEDGTHVQKILAHRQDEPEPINVWNRDVPSDLAQMIVGKMMAKSRAQRFQTPAQVASALEPWVRQYAKEATILPLPDLEAGQSSATSALDEIDPTPESITITCSLCGTRVGAMRSQFGTKVECPDCGTKIPVAWPRKAVKVESPKPEISTYDVLPSTPNPKLRVPLPEYNLLGSDDRPGRSAARPQSLQSDRSGWKGPLLILSGAVLGAALVVGILAWSGLLRVSGLGGPTGTAPAPSVALGPALLDESFGFQFSPPDFATPMALPSGFLGHFRGGAPPFEIFLIGSVGNESRAEFEQAAIERLRSVQVAPPTDIRAHPAGPVQSRWGGEIHFSLMLAQGPRTLVDGDPQVSQSVPYHWLFYFTEEPPQKLMVAFLVPDQNYATLTPAIVQSLASVALRSKLALAKTK